MTRSCERRDVCRRRAGYAPTLVIMVKEPLAGRVKSRLARAIGAASAAAIYRVMQSSSIARLSHSRRWRTTLAVTPDTAVASRMLPGGCARIAQGGGDLGARLARLAQRLPPGPVVFIGSDIPAITPRDIAAAFQALGTHDAVFGPSPDGGYWLAGLKRIPRVLPAFHHVRWSTANALADTIANLEGRTIARLRTLSDVDTASDLAALRVATSRRILPVVPVR